MDISKLVLRSAAPEPFSEGSKIPWNDPDFSQRMLQEHLTDRHNLASPKAANIECHVNWIHNVVLGGEQTRILDLGCGPGLYSSRLGKLGHGCTGIDFGPASVEYARKQESVDKVGCEYVFGDLRNTDFGESYGLVMMLHGEMNTFSHREIRDILRKAFNALTPNGKILFVGTPIDKIKPTVAVKREWSSAETGLFSAKPHILLTETLWFEQEQALIERYFVIENEGGDIRFVSGTTRGYNDIEYRDLFEACGFDQVEIITPHIGNQNDNFTVSIDRTIIATKTC